VRVEAGGIGIEYEVTGAGPPVVLLHGFPDTGRLWRHQVPALVEAGFQAIVPDLRGYGRSDKPTEVEAYRRELLVGDVLAVMSDAGAERAHVVGHDWGASLAWATALTAGERVDHLVALSVGHPASFSATNIAQLEKSWYMLFFQFREIAEQWLRAGAWANFRAWAGHPDAEATIAELETNGSLTPALNYYRANLPPDSYLRSRASVPPARCPTMGVWSSGDRFLLESQMSRSGDHVAGPWRYARLEGPGHWMQLEAPAAVNELLVDFLPAP
jgi:pimeloyl-ACP methyl ester carboxylesterase